MSKFKVGDKVRYKEGLTHLKPGPLEMDHVYTIRAFDGKKFYLLPKDNPWGISGSNFKDFTWEVEEHQLQLISTNITNMSISEKFLLAFKAEPEKSFRKAGITNGDDFLTDEGQKIFLSWLLKKNGDGFKKEVVDGLLEEDKENK